ncbi:hypothetical protein Gocc_0191 [Gaiella occulta]|uniref:Uncharacterized protein n=1 Tax=Gaiella occulta TaxID=1002870 RepID=A0A7M2Z1T4_9ACTN|nr:hypothetical protein [Gaiella occulta]RDI75772.1 hypothetical protein Gocc_0191 [Gaiella occulta]
MDWNAHQTWAEAEHATRSTRPLADGEREDFHLAAVAGASWAAGLAALMRGAADEGAALLRRAAAEYRVSWEAAPPGSWGRPIAALRCRLLAGDVRGAAEDGRLTLEAGAASADGPIAAYATVLALLALGRDEEALAPARGLVGRDDFVEPVADALVALAAGDEPAYDRAVRQVLLSFEARDAFLEHTPVADTVLVLDALARSRGFATAPLTSPLLPAAG